MRWIPAVVALACLSAASQTARAQTTLALRTFGGPGLDVGNSIHPLQAGGFLVAGYTGGPAGSDPDAWLLRFDEQGDTLWTRQYGGAGADYAWDVAEASDGTFRIVGFRETITQDEDVWVLAVDSAGEVLWERALGGPGSQAAWALEVLDGGDILVLGETTSVDGRAQDVLLIRLDAMGDTVWTRTVGGEGTDRAFSLTRTPEGAVFAGVTASDAGDQDVLVGSVTQDGEVQIRHLRAPGDQIGHGVLRLRDGGFLVTGYGSAADDTPNDVLFLYLDDALRESHRVAAGGPEDDRAMMTARSPGGALGTVGYVQHAGDWDLNLFEGPLRDPARRAWSPRMPGAARGVMVVGRIDGTWILTGTLEEGADEGQLFFAAVSF